MDKLEKVSKVLGYVDYAAAVGCLIYGLFTMNWVYVALGGAGIGIAYLKPADQVKKLLLKKFMRKPVFDSRHDSIEEFTPKGHTAIPVQERNYRPVSRYTSSTYLVGPKAKRVKERNPRDHSSALSNSVWKNSIGHRPAAISLKGN